MILAWAVLLGGLSMAQPWHQKEVQARPVGLTDQEATCTQDGGTEAPFTGKYNDFDEPGLYVDPVGGQPLFSSQAKYHSGTGWPSFSQSLGTVLEKVDRSHGMLRTEVRSAAANSHLGHVFDDGHSPSGRRFCINSASLRFVPLHQLRESTLSAYLFDFAQAQGWSVATLAGGCFWGVEELLGSLPGVITTQVGYTGGEASQANYAEVCKGKSQHAEAVQVLFDPAKLSYEALLLYFFRMHDPTTRNSQANDKGTQYRSAIFYADAKQKQEAEAVMARVTASHAWKAPLTTELAPLAHFFRAEPMHQQYLKRHPQGYRCHTVHNLTF